MKYRIDIKLTGFEEVVVEASNIEEAYEKALDRFWEIYDTAPAKNLRWKSTEMDILSEGE